MEQTTDAKKGFFFFLPLRQYHMSEAMNKEVKTEQYTMMAITHNGR